jgi:hypothetical protein
MLVAFVQLDLAMRMCVYICLYICTCMLCTCMQACLRTCSCEHGAMQFICATQCYESCHNGTWQLASAEMLAVVLLHVHHAYNGWYAICASYHQQRLTLPSSTRLLSKGHHGPAATQL